MLLKINRNTFNFKVILYRVKTFRSIYYPEIFSMTDSDSSLSVNITIEHLEEHDKYILNSFELKVCLTY